MDKDNVNNPFSMTGTREVLLIDAVHFEHMLRAIEQAMQDSPGLVFDLAKSLIETACKTILKDRGLSFENTWDLPRLLKETTGKLQLIPSDIDNSPEIDTSLKKTIGGLQTAIHGICELRQTQGVASHGKDAYFQQLEQIQALMVARSADVIVNFLFSVHRNYPVSSNKRRLLYGASGDYNDWIDEQNETVRIFSLKYKPSDVLFKIDRDAYGEILSDFETERRSEDESSVPNIQSENESE